MSGSCVPDGGRPFRRAAVRTGLLALVLLVLPAGAEPGEGTPASDWQLTLQARTALWDDPLLAKFNLAVQVRRGRATLLGPVPSADIADLALARLRGVPGVREVANETYVPLPDDPLAQALPPPVTARRPAAPAAASANPLGPPATDPPASPVPVPVEGREPTATLLPPVAAPAVSLSLAERIEQLRQADRRFRGIRADVRDGRVVLSGTVARPQDAWEFAEAVRKLPGVAGVVLRTQ